MDRKNIVKYILKDNFKGVLAFYGTLLFIIVASRVWLTIDPKIDVGISGWEVASLIYIFVAFTGTTKEYTKFLIQNGYSRKTIFEGIILSNLALALIFTILTQVFGALTNVLLDQSYSTLADLIYGNTQNLGILGVCMWVWVFHVLLGCIGYCIGAFYGSAAKVTKVFVSVFVPVLFVILLPILDFNFFNGNISQIILKGYYILFGYYQSSFNIWLSVGGIFLTAAITLCVIYPTCVRRWKFN